MKNKKPKSFVTQIRISDNGNFQIKQPNRRGMQILKKINIIQGVFWKNNIDKNWK